MDDSARLCRRCRKPVKVRYDDYDLFEQMHWLCFHLEFEHDADPDEPCSDPGSPWWHIEVYKEALRKLNHDPEKVLKEAISAMASRDYVK